MAKTFCPTRNSLLVPTYIGAGRLAPMPICSTARSYSSARPTRRAGKPRPSATRRIARLAPAMTWLFVTTWPSPFPVESRSASDRHVVNASRPGIDLALFRRDEHNAVSRALENRDRTLFRRGEITPRRNGAWLGEATEQDPAHERETLPRSHDEKRGHGDGNQTGEEPKVQATPPEWNNQDCS